jgi:glycosyltransferase involved in cell wall biosynthesis
LSGREEALSMTCPALPEDFVPEATSPSSSAALPTRLLYATSAALGGTGLDSTSLEGVLAAHQSGCLLRALCFGSTRTDFPARSLKHHPVRLLSALESEEYYAAKKRYTAWMAARELRHGNYDFFHGWSGDCFPALIEARRQGIPSVMDIPTWHRNKGSAKPGETKAEREERLTSYSWRQWRKFLPIDRVRALAEYELTDLLLMPSRKSAETFIAAGVPSRKLHYVARGVDPSRYAPGTQPTDVFRVIFVGALIRRKGVHHLLAAWKKLALKDAELLLVGSLHDEMKPFLKELSTPSLRHVGFSSSVQKELQRSSAFVFPTECEGFAKVTLEAAACALPLITTAESGDALVDGVNGIQIPPNDPDALAAAIQALYSRRGDLAAMGMAGRQRVLRCLTWDHYRARILAAYRRLGTPA